MVSRDIEIKKILGEMPSDKNVRAYLEELIDIRNEIQELEVEIAETPVGLTGYNFHSEAAQFEQQLINLESKIEDARLVIVTGDFSHLESINPPHSSSINKEMEEWVSKGTFDAEIDDLKSKSGRVNNKFEAKRSSAIARTGLLISLIALFVSIIVMFVSLIQLFDYL